MATLRDSYNTGNDDLRGITNTTWYGQTIALADSYIISSVKLKLYRSGTPGTVTVSIRATSGGLPTGADLTSGTTDGDTLTTDSGGEWREITFSSTYTLIGNTTYAIVVRSGAAGLRWNCDSSSPTYSNGSDVASTDSGSSWAATTTNDFMFEAWGNDFIPDEKVYSRQLVAIANNEVWYESSAGTMAELAAATGNVDCALPLSAVEAFQKVFIANQTNLKVVDFVNTKISTADAGLNPCTKGMELTGTGGGKMLVDYADGVTDDAAALVYGYVTTSQAILSTDTMTGTNGDGNAVSFTLDAPVVSAPHWYNWTSFGQDTTTYGTMPASAYILARYRGRLVLAGNPNKPHQWYMSKNFDPWNWKYGANDPMSAVSGQDADAGELGDVIRALIPYGDDYMVIGGANSVHLMTGDPALGGSIDEISDTAGFYSFTSWCKDDDGNLYFLGASGLYKMEGGRSRPQNISAGSLPQLLSDLALDTSEDRVILQFDPDRQGILICKTDMTDNTNQNYWFSLKTQGFYPETYPEECGIYSSCYYQSDTSTYREALYGCADGYIRYFKNTAKDDDIGGSDEAISSYLTLSAFPVGDGADNEGKIKQIVFESAGGASGGDYSDTDGFSYFVYKGDDAETCIEDVIDGATAALSATITGTGRKSRARSRIRGQYGTIKIANAISTETFALNRILIDKDIVGRLKDN